MLYMQLNGNMFWYNLFTSSSGSNNQNFLYTRLGRTKFEEIFDICFSTRKAVLQWLNYRQQDQLLWQ